MDDNHMRKWLGSKWNSLLGYIPQIVKLMKDWYSFHFMSVEDLEIILTLPLVHGKGFLTLHKWYIGYNPLRNTPSNNLIWMNSHGLPIELWTKETLSHIGNAIGKIFYVDPKFLGAKDKRVAWILIEKVYRGGFPNHIELFCGDLNMKQRLDC